MCNNRKNETVQDIISKPPHKIIRWGTLCISLVFIILFVLSFFFKYPKFIQTEIIVENDFVSVVAENDGVFFRLFKENEEKVEMNDTLASVFDKGNIFFLKSPRKGMLMYGNNWLYKKQYKRNDNLFYIISQDNKNYAGYIKIPASLYSKITVGQQVYIYLAEYPLSIYGMVIGTVNMILEMPGKDFYKVIITVPNKTNLNKKILIDTCVKAEAKIVIEYVNLGKKIISPFWELFK